jgi:hypothetical protein
MVALTSKRREAFAQELAKGKTITQAYADAGYQPCRQNASRLASNDDIAQRIIEIKSQRQIDTKNGRDPETGQFLVGHNGNGGRPKGSRNKLGEEFIADLHAEWQRSGAEALERVAKDDPTQFVRVVASILPKEIDQTISIESELFREAADFREAWRLARQFIGSDDDKLIELQPEDQIDVE